MDRATFDELKRLAERAGFQLIQSDYLPETFGHWFMILLRRRSLVRMSWDGRDRWIALELGDRSKCAFSDIRWADAWIGKDAIEQTPESILNKLESLAI